MFFPQIKSGCKQLLFWVVGFVCSGLLVFLFWKILGRMQVVYEPEIKADQKLQCVSYTPFMGNEAPYELPWGLTFPPQRLENDIALLSKNFKCLRIYSVTGLELVPPLAKKYGMQVLLGAWVNADPIATRKELDKAVGLAQQYPQTIQAVIVGNEALLRKEVTGRQLANYIRSVKARLPQIPVTYADVWEFWLSHPEIPPVVDFITIHILPYWENNPASIASAMGHVQKVYLKVSKKFSDKEIFIGETGWPSFGRMREGAHPSRVNQARFIRGFVDRAEKKGWSYNLIEAFDQPWKRMNEGAVGGYWGLYDRERNEKQILRGPVSNHPQWFWGFQISLGVLILLFLLRTPLTCWFSCLFLSGILTLGACLTVLTAQHYFLMVFNGRQIPWMGVVLMLSLVGTVLSAKLVLHPSQTFVPSFDSLFKTPATSLNLLSEKHGLTLFVVLSAVMVLIESMGFVFDSRYRSFPVFGLIMPVLATFKLYLRQQGLDHERNTERLFGFFIAACALFIFVNETPLNWQSNLWVLLCFLFAGSLMKSAGKPYFPFYLKKAFFSALLSYGFATLIRYGLMEPTSISDLCIEGPDFSLCRIRGMIGLLIHFKAFAWLALLSSTASYFVPGRALVSMGMVASLFGMVLYQLNLSTIAFVFVLLNWNRSMSVLLQDKKIRSTKIDFVLRI